MLFKDIFGEESEADLYLEGNNLMESNDFDNCKATLQKTQFY